MNRLTTVCLGAAMLCLVGACSRTQPANIVLIVVDTLRADRIGAAGNRRGLTPFIDSLAERGYVFRNAYATSAWTNPSVASILTSRYQSQHGIVTFESVLADSEVTLPELLKQRGYTTGLFSANGLISRKMGFAQGYDEFKSILVKPGAGTRQFWVPERATRINADALTWLDAVEKNTPQAPIFLHLHYMEPHHPYAPKPQALDHVANGNAHPDVERANGTAFFGNMIEMDADMLRNLQDVYDAEVLSLDMALRDLFAELEKRHVLDNAVVVLTADHGEEFKEHGLIGHDKTLFEEVVRVPLVMVVPGQDTRTDVDQVVSLVDLAPTLVDLAGGAVAPSFEGESFKGRLVSDPNRWRLFSSATAPRDGGPGIAYTELIKNQARDLKRFKPHEHAVIAGTHKMIAGTNGEREYYDLKADPGETNPAALAEADRAALQTAYDGFLTRARERTAPRNVETLDAETRERMRALGYDH